MDTGFLPPLRHSPGTLVIAHFLETRGLSRRASRLLVMAIAGTLLATIMILESLFNLDYSLGVFYAVPVVVAATVLNRYQTLALAVFSAWARSLFTTGLPPVEFWLRFIMAVLAYGGVGVLVSEMSRNRRMILAAFARLQTEREMRRRAEDQLRILVESSPAAIMTLNHRAEVVAANRAAHQMLGFDEPGSLMGVSVSDYIPVFSGALRVSPGGKPIRVSSTCWARRANGSHFPAAVWFSTYEEEGQWRLAGIMVDTSEEVREREHETMRNLAESNRLLAGAVAHEIRNLCSAVRVVTSNLGRRPEIAADADFGALNKLVESLTRIAAFELTGHKTRVASRVDVTRVLEELRVVIEPDWTEAGGVIEWNTGGLLPYVHVDEHALLQVFLNLSQNALRAAQRGGEPRLVVHAAAENGRAIITFQDFGPGVENSSELFQPFRENSDGSGLGLYVSRAMMRGFGGDLLYVAGERGCRFDIVLPTYEVAREMTA
jgi:two-component system sensor kinase FixL